MEDLGYLKLKPVMEWRSLESSSTYWEMKKLIGRETDEYSDKAVSVECLRRVPIEYCRSSVGDCITIEDHETEI
jgi:hypothetical protein